MMITLPWSRGVGSLRFIPALHPHRRRLRMIDQPVPWVVSLLRQSRYPQAEAPPASIIGCGVPSQSVSQAWFSPGQADVRPSRHVEFVVVWTRR
jgi:hypothetical protein